MATISNGTTSLTPATVADEQTGPIMDMSTRQTAGGSERTQVAGERIGIRVKMRLTASECNTLLSIYTNNTSGYWYYTPQTTSGIYGSLTLPIVCTMSKPEPEWDNRSYYYVSFDITSVDYR